MRQQLRATELLLEALLSLSSTDDALKVVTKTRPRRLAAATLRGNTSDTAWRIATETIASVYTKAAERSNGAALGLILARPETTATLNLVLQEAEKASLDSARRAWADGARAGKVAAAAMNSPLDVAPAAATFLPLIQSDIRRNAASAIALLNEQVAAATHPSQIPGLVRQVMNELARRARLSVTVTYNRAYNASIDAAASQNDQRLLWVSALHANTCPICAALHGTIVAPGEDFDSTLTLKGTYTPGTYASLPFPPRHPGCYCQIVTTSIRASAISSMQTFARERYAA